MRVVVVGSGVIGLLTAIECARAGARVDLVDRADVPSPWSTSNDRHRVIRALHKGSAPLTTAAARAHEAWLDVERRVGTPFYHRVGALTAMPVDEVPGNLALLTGAGAAAHVLGAGELASWYPRIRFPAGVAGVVEPAVGAVLADRAMSALAGWLDGRPAVRAHPYRRVVEVDDRGAVRLDDGAVLAADCVVLATGPWSRELLPAALADRLTLYRQSMLSYAPTPTRAAWAGVPAMPSLGTPQGAWLMPPIADTPARLSASTACRPVDAMTDRGTPDRWREYLVELFRTLLIDFDPAAVVGTTDGYYLADDSGEGPLLAVLGGGAVLAYAACGGMSFKFAPLVAGAIADRAVGRTPRRTGLTSVDQPREYAAADRSGLQGSTR